MPKTPSIGLDQNKQGRFIDKYWGRVPMFLHKIEEAYIYVCNPEYVYLLYTYLEGDIDKENLSIELYREIEDVLSYWGDHYSIMPRYIAVVLQCLEDMYNINNPVDPNNPNPVDPDIPDDPRPPGTGPDDDNCLILHMYNPNLGEWDRWQTSNDLQYILHFSDTRRCDGGAVVPDVDCYKVTVADETTTQPRDLVVNGLQYRMSLTYGSCGELPEEIIWGNECDDVCPQCMSFCVYDEEDNKMNRVMMYWENLYVSSIPESCALLPEPPVFGPNPDPDCVGDECPDCMPVNVYDGHTDTMNRLILNNGNGFQVGKAFESCANVPVSGPSAPTIKWGNECEGTCLDCMSLHVHDKIDNVMRKVILDDQNMYMGSTFESCATVPIVIVPDPHTSPNFGKTCTVNCPNCLGLYVYDKYNDVMERLLMGGGTVSVGKDEGSCAQVTPPPSTPDPTLVVNAAPVANAGLNQIVNAGDVVALDGSGSYDANNDNLSYEWVFASKPAGSTAHIWFNLTATPTFDADIAGTYVIGLVVDDGVLESQVSTVSIIVEQATSRKFIPVGHNGVRIMDGGVAKQLMVFI